MAKENHGTVKAPLVRHSNRLNNQSRFLQSPLYNLLHAQAKIYMLTIHKRTRSNPQILISFKTTWF